MPKKTREEKGKLNTSSTRITQEEYEKAKEDLEYYKSEYNWITSRDMTTAIREVREEAQKIRAMINSEKTKEQLYYQKYYNTLVIKEGFIERGEYATILLSRVSRLLEKVKQYEIDVQEFTIRDILRSMIGLDTQTKEVRKVNTLLRKIRIDGLPKDVNLDVQSIEKILDDMRKYSRLVGIKIPNIEQEPTKELTVSNGYLTKAQKEFYERVRKEILGRSEETIDHEATDKTVVEVNDMKIKIDNEKHNEQNAKNAKNEKNKSEKDVASKNEVEM